MIDPRLLVLSVISKNHYVKPCAGRVNRRGTHSFGSRPRNEKIGGSHAGHEEEQVTVSTRALNFFLSSNSKYHAPEATVKSRGVPCLQ